MTSNGWCSHLYNSQKFLVRRALQFVPQVQREVSEQEIRISLSEGRHEARMVEAASRAAIARYPASAPHIEAPLVLVEQIQSPRLPPPESEPMPARVPQRSNRMPWPQDYFGVRPLEQNDNAGGIV